MPFDETIVKYYWVSERLFEIVDIELRSKNKTVLIEQALLTTDGTSVEEILQATAEAEGTVSVEDTLLGTEEGDADIEVDDIVIVENAF